MLKIIFRNTAALKINRKISYGKSCGEIRHLCKVSLCQVSVNLQRSEKKLDVIWAIQVC